MLFGEWQGHIWTRPTKSPDSPQQLSAMGVFAQIGSSSGWFGAWEASGGRVAVPDVFFGFKPPSVLLKQPCAFLYSGPGAWFPVTLGWTCGLDLDLEPSGPEGSWETVNHQTTSGKEADSIPKSR